MGIEAQSVKQAGQEEPGMGLRRSDSDVPGFLSVFSVVSCSRRWAVMGWGWGGGEVIDSAVENLKNQRLPHRRAEWGGKNST